MLKNSNRKIMYLIIIILTIVVSITSATYAYWAASASSMTNTINTSSTIYNVSMQITSLYQGHTLIPMRDEEALKGLKNKCMDKYNRGACYAYNIRVYDYSKDLTFISGFMDINTNNMANISYMMYRISEEYNEDNCIKINNKNYCIVKEPTHMQDGIGLSLGDKYDVSGTTETEFILQVWLTNLNNNQNDMDIGEFNAIVTMQAGNGGEIKGSISNVIIPEINEESGDTN